MTMPLLSDEGSIVQLLVIVIGWFSWSVVCGYTAHRRPAGSFDPTRLPYRLLAWERNGRVYGRIGIRRWKGLLPEAGDVFAGGFSKRQLRSRDPQYLDRFLAETCRAEFTHWAIMAIAPLCFVVFDPLVAALNCVFAVVANIPCLLVQRFNRGRLVRLRARRAAAGRS